MKNKALVMLVGLVLIAIGLVGCSDSGSAASHGTYAYIPDDTSGTGWDCVIVEDYGFDAQTHSLWVDTADGRTIKGYNITIVEE
jgi:hypothetical protein